MKYITITIFLFLSVIIANAALAPSLVVNDNLKECHTYQPNSSTTLPSGWRYYNYDTSNYESTHKNKCEQIGYKYIDGYLEGELLPVERNFRIIFYLVFSLGLISFAVLYFKTKNKKIFIATIIFIIICLSVWGIWNFRIE
jgi:hypothetical protein